MTFGDLTGLTGLAKHLQCDSPCIITSKPPELCKSFSYPLLYFLFIATPALLCAHMTACFYQKDLYHPCWPFHSLQYASLYKQEHNKLTDHYLNRINAEVWSPTSLFVSLSDRVAGVKCLPLLVVLPCIWCPSKILLHQSTPWRKYKIGLTLA